MAFSLPGPNAALPQTMLLGRSSQLSHLVLSASSSVASGLVQCKFSYSFDDAGLGLP